MNKGELPLSEVRFMSKTHHHEKFQTWVGIMLGQPGMSRRFQDLGILRAISQARKASVERDPKDLEFLLSRWSTETHSFVTAWGEFGPTLEDVAVLTSLPIFGDTQVAHFKLTEKENKDRHEALTSFLQKTKYGAAKKATFLTWATYFVEGPGNKSAHQLEAFLAYWLNYFVFPSPPEDGVQPSIFPMAVLLARGKKLPLAAWFLGTMYARLDEAARNTTRSMGRYDVVSYVDANFLQLFLWERFEGLAPKPRNFKVPRPQIVDGVEKVKTSLLASRARRWYGQACEEKVPLIHLIDEEGTYNFRPYSLAPPGVLPVGLYSPVVSEERSLQERPALPEELKMLLAILAPTMLPSITETGEVLTSYSPQRLLRQFGLDQGAVVVLGESCLGVWDAEGRFTMSGRDMVLAGWSSIFWPSLSREGALSPGGALYWLRCLEGFIQFVAPDSPDPVLFAPVVLIPARDPYLRASKDFGGSTLQAAKARKQLGDVIPPTALVPPQPSHSAESTAPQPSSAIKGKEVATSPLENPKKKRKLTKASAAEAKKKKLMSDAMPPTIVIEVATESSPTFAPGPLDLQPVPDVEGEDSGEVEEQLDVDFPLMILPAPEPEVEATPSDVVAGVLSQLAPIEGMDESEGDGALSPPDLSPEPIGEAGASSPPRAQVLSFAAGPSHQTPPVTASTPDSRARFYERFFAKSPQPSPEARLDCGGHPFFVDVPNISQDQKDFFNKVLAKVGDIFGTSVIEWEPLKELVLKGIFEAAKALESYSFVDVPDEVLSSVARTVATAERMSIRMDWLDGVLGDICLRRDRLALSRKEVELQARLAELLEEVREIEQQLGEVRAEMSTKGPTSSLGDSDKIIVFSG